jgi:protein SCO1/2
MEVKPARPAWQVAVLVMIAIGGVLGGSLYARSRLTPAPHDTAKPATRAALVYDRPRPLAPFTLVDEAGAAATKATLSGHWSLLFFGYTHCPDVCPATLAELARVRERLADLPRDRQPAVYLVSVDPGRDDVATLAGYVHFFAPDFHALTGEPAALEAFTRGLGVAVIVRRPAADQPAADYTVDHTAAILLVDPAGAVVALFPAPHQVAVIDADYRALVTAASRTGP